MSGAETLFVGTSVGILASLWGGMAVAVKVAR